MKEDKFILIGMVCLIVFCKLWMLFGTPCVDMTAETVGTPDTALVTPMPEQTTADTAALAPGVDTTASPAAEPVKSDSTNIKKITKKRNFVECGSQFMSENNINIVNGVHSRQYTARNIVTCTCDMDGTLVDKTVVFTYSRKPTRVELKCHSKCVDICAQ